jgi:hypothetical protein
MKQKFLNRIVFSVALSLSTLQLEATRMSTPILSIYTDNEGVVVPNGPRLYATIDSDGFMKYMEMKGDGSAVLTRKLSAEQMKMLRTAIADQRLIDLKGVVAATFHPDVRDFRTSLKVSIYRGHTLQKLEFRNYDPSDNRPFPAGADHLLCVVDQLRAASYKLSGDCP